MRVGGSWERERDNGRDFEELGYVIMKAGKSKICGVDQQAGDPGESLML